MQKSKEIDIVVSDYVVQSLAAHRIDHVFLVPGKLVYPLLQSVNQAPTLKGVVAAHETAAGFMADGYARASGKFGVCLGISGPGTMNFVPAMAAAHADRVPVLYLVGAIASDREGRGAFQDGGHSGLAECAVVRPLVSAVSEIRHPANLACELKRLTAQLNWQRRGRAFLSIPLDVQAQTASLRPEARPPAALAHATRAVPADAALIENLLADYILQSKRVAFLAGSRANNPATARLLLAVAEKFMIPVATTLSGKGAFPEDHPLALGIYGFAGHGRAIDVINTNKLDVLFVLGCDMNQRDSLNWSEQLGENKLLIAIDDDFEQAACHYPVDIDIFSGIAASLQGMLASPAGDAAQLAEVVADREEWVQFIVNKIPLLDRRNEPPAGETGAGNLHPGHVIAALRAACPADTNVVVDSGAHRVFMAHYWTSHGAGDYYASSAIAPMGWAIAAGIGVKLGAPERACMVVTGDGCMLMHGVEIQTAARYGAKVIYVVLNNAAHGAIHIDALAGAGISADYTALPGHDWAAFAAALGVPSCQVASLDQVEGAMTRAMQADGPFLIEVLTGVHRAPNRYFAESQSLYARKAKPRSAGDGLLSTPVSAG